MLRYNEYIIGLYPHVKLQRGVAVLTLHEKFVVDGKGKKTATILPYTEWKKIVDVLEEYEEICAYDKAKSRPPHPVSFKKAIKKLKSPRS
jgi:hypothetical protein